MGRMKDTGYYAKEFAKYITKPWYSIATGNFEFIDAGNYWAPLIRNVIVGGIIEGGKFLATGKPPELHLSDSNLILLADGMLEGPLVSFCYDAIKERLEGRKMRVPKKDTDVSMLPDEKKASFVYENPFEPGKYQRVRV